MASYANIVLALLLVVSIDSEARADVSSTKLVISVAKRENESIVQSKYSFFLNDYLQQGDYKKWLKGYQKGEKGSKTFVVIHGWDSDTAEEWVVDLSNALINKGHDDETVTVIALDWADEAHRGGFVITYKKDYRESRRFVKINGKLLGSFLGSHTTVLSNIHVIGHSLGAHLAGFTGKSFKNTAENSKGLYRITGLDPAGPGFENLRNKKRLAKSDAQFVDVIHTAAETYGIAKSVGHADFYVAAGPANEVYYGANKYGRMQPNTPEYNSPRRAQVVYDGLWVTFGKRNVFTDIFKKVTGTFKLLSKSHSRAVSYFTYTVETNSKAFPAKSNSSTAEPIFMGYDVSRNARGAYNVDLLKWPI